MHEMSRVPLRSGFEGERPAELHEGPAHARRPGQRDDAARGSELPHLARDARDVSRGLRRE
jgi:hypothetical protein